MAKKLDSNATAAAVNSFNNRRSPAPSATSAADEGAKKMGRPMKKESLKAKNKLMIYLTDDMLEQLKAHSESTGISMSAVCNLAIKKYLE